MLTSKRVFDVLVAGGILTLASPLMLIAAIGIKLTSPGPIFFHCMRMAFDRRRERRSESYHGREFVMYKFRTMCVGTPKHRHRSPRGETSGCSRGGVCSERPSCDELPQLLNVVRGDMALVGPRPEAPEIVRQYYSIDDLDHIAGPSGRHESWHALLLHARRSDAGGAQRS